MSQSSAIAASLLIAFVVFITVRGELPCYMEVLGISTGGQCNFGACSQAAATAPAGAASNAVNNFIGGGGGGITPGGIAYGLPQPATGGAEWGTVPGFEGTSVVIP